MLASASFDIGEFQGLFRLGICEGTSRWSVEAQEPNYDDFFDGIVLWPRGWTALFGMKRKELTHRTLEMSFYTIHRCVPAC